MKNSKKLSKKQLKYLCITYTELSPIAKFSMYEHKGTSERKRVLEHRTSENERTSEHSNIRKSANIRTSNISVF